MYKLVARCVLLLLVWSPAYSQQASKGFFSITAGASIPIGDFSKKDIYSNRSGIAKTGQALGLSYDQLLGKTLGISFAIRGQRSPVDGRVMESFLNRTPFAQGFWSISPGQPPPGPAHRIYTNWKMEKRSWLAASAMAGAYADFPLKENGNVSFLARAMIGFVYVSSPAVKGNSISDTASAYIEQDSRSGTGISYSLGGGIKFAISPRFSLLGNLDYFGTNNITFRKVKAVLITTTGTPGQPDYAVSQSQATGDARQVISSINISIGVALSLP